MPRPYDLNPRASATKAAGHRGGHPLPGGADALLTPGGGRGTPGHPSSGPISAPYGRSPGGEVDHIRDEADYAAHVRYCWINPVRHGFVERAVDWPYSSIHRDIRLGRVGPEWSGLTPDGEYGE